MQLGLKILYVSQHVKIVVYYYFWYTQIFRQIYKKLP